MDKNLALETLKSFVENTDNVIAKNAILALHPELAESEDERIRKFLIDYFEIIKSTLCDGLWKGFQIGEILDYLKKQKEQRPVINIEHLKSYMLQYLQDASNRKEDSEIEADTDKYARMIVKVFGGIEQKPADDEAKAIAYREYERGRESGLRDGQKYVLDNAESYGLCKPAEWSEEDEKIIDAIIRNLEYLRFDTVCSETTKENLEKRIKWLGRLKSLLPQPKEDWTEYDEAHMNWLCRIVHSRRVHGELSLAEESELGKWMDKWLNHNPQPHWKPREEQIYSLGTVVNGYDNCTVGSVGYNLKELYEQLKKLM